MPISDAARETPYEETRNRLPAINTNRKRYFSIDKTIVTGDNNPQSAPWSNDLLQDKSFVFAGHWHWAGRNDRLLFCFGSSVFG